MRESFSLSCERECISVCVTQTKTHFSVFHTDTLTLSLSVTQTHTHTHTHTHTLTPLNSHALWMQGRVPQFMRCRETVCVCVCVCVCVRRSDTWLMRWPLCPSQKHSRALVLTLLHTHTTPPHHHNNTTAHTHT